MAHRKDMLLAIGVGEPEYPEFDIPEGLDVTELEEGGEKEILAKIKRKGDKLCLVSVDGIPLAETEDEVDDDEAVDEEYAAEDAKTIADSNPYRESVAERAAAAGLI